MYNVLQPQCTPNKNINDIVRRYLIVQVSVPYVYETHCAYKYPNPSAGTVSTTKIFTYSMKLLDNQGTLFVMGLLPDT